VLDLNSFIIYHTPDAWIVGRKISEGVGGQRKKQGRKIAPLNLPLLYQYHV